MLKKLLLVGAAALPIVAGAAGTPAATGALDDLDIGTFSANVGVFTDYVFRGVSQTNESPAIQGGIDWEHGLGAVGEDTGLSLFAGIWGSNVDFPGITSESVELDIYGGLSGEVPVGSYLQSISYQVGGIYYWYPGASSDLDFDYVEAFGGLGFNFQYFSVDGTVYYSPEYFGDTGESIYIEGNVAVPLADTGFTLNGTFGYFDIENSSALDYYTWGGGLDFAMGKLHSNLDALTLGFRYVDTDIPDSICGPQLCDERFVVSLTAEIGG